jgi:sulfite reductase (NADPH) hemoprotein beta-component
MASFTDPIMDPGLSIECAVAQVAYLASDVVISVQPSLATKTAFSTHLDLMVAKKTPGIVSKTLPQVQSVRENNEPLLSVLTPAQSGKLVSVTTTDSILLSSISHLYKIAEYPVVMHVALQPSNFPDFAPVASIRNAGWIMLQSQTAQEAQDMALTAHALSIRSGRAVMHFFAPEEQLISASPSLVRAIELATVGDILSIDIIRQSQTEPGEQKESRGGPTGAPIPANSSSDVPAIEQFTTIITSDVILQYVTDIWSHLASKTGRKYHPFEYDGAPDAHYCIAIFGSSARLLSQGINSDDILKGSVGVLTARLYRPWLGSALLQSMPLTIKRLVVLEQLHAKTTRWGPVLLDVLASTNGRRGDMEVVVGHQLGYLDSGAAATHALQELVKNISSQAPSHDVEIGIPAATVSSLRLSSASSKPAISHLETSYANILHQTFGNRLYLANAIAYQHVGLPSAVITSPEFGFGSLLARKELQIQFLSQVKQAVSLASFATDAPRDWLTRWSTASSKDPARADQLADDVIARLEVDGSSTAARLLQHRGLLRKESLWLMGSDAWAYDLGNSGVHHVLASGQNVNMLIIDSTPYSERSLSDLLRRKKDIGLYAMNYGNVYVASVAVYGSYTQVLQAMTEADRFEGPSVVLAYLPHFDENDSALTVLQETKKAVDMGYWPLYRWNPDNERMGLSAFSLDSQRIKQELKDFLARDSRLTQLMRARPSLGTALTQDIGAKVRQLQRRKAKDAYSSLLDGLAGAPLTVLFASDNGAAASVAKRLGTRGRGRGLKTLVMAMEDYPIEDLAGEEHVVFVTATAGQGEFPQNGRLLWEVLKDSPGLDLSAVQYSIFGLGDSHYWPRKEDRLYFNKPAKDLDRILGNLGAKKLADTGLGDDQDPDGYETAYREWETTLWDALHVGGDVHGIPDDPPPVSNEDIKLESNYLRGTIIQGLADATTGSISASDQQLTKFHGTYMQDDRDVREERKTQGLEPAYSFMIRCRLPGGVATPTQWLQMDDISTTLGNETMKLTTRQTFQFHGVVKSRLRPAMQAINRALMTTLAACGDVNRNVMCSPLPSQSEYHREVYACSRLISDHLLPSTTAYHEIWLSNDGALSSEEKKVKIAGDVLQDFEPLYGPTYLPRKFKITIAIPPHNDTDVYAHDIGLIAIKGADGHLAGFNMLVGGGMGATHNNKKTYPQIGRMFGFVRAEDVHVACEHVMTVQRDHGDRQNRKHARLKYTIDDMGVDVFRKKVEERWGAKFKPERPFAFDSNIDTFGWQRDELGLNHFTVFIENGRVEDSPDLQLKTGLREIAKMHKGEFRLTANQHVIVSNVTDERLPDMKTHLRKYGLDNLHYSGLRLSSSACVAFPTCGLAMAESERYLPALITKLESCLEENGLRQDSIVMRMTGCPNGCARPWIAEVAFVGKAYGAYNMYLGGGYHGQRLNKLYRSSIKEDEILAIMKPLFKRYALERYDGERFGDFCIRVGVIKLTLEGRDFHDDAVEV